MNAVGDGVLKSLLCCLRQAMSSCSVDVSLDAREL